MLGLWVLSRGGSVSLGADNVLAGVFARLLLQCFVLDLFNISTCAGFGRLQVGRLVSRGELGDPPPLFFPPLVGVVPVVGTSFDAVARENKHAVCFPLQTSMIVELEKCRVLR